MKRREFLKALGYGTLASCTALAAGQEKAGKHERREPTMPKRLIEHSELMKPTKSDDKMNWYDISAWGVEGKGWDDTERYYDRFPSRAKGKVRAAVWNLSRHSAGMSARLVTDAKMMHARWTLLSDRLAMAHMPATGVSGLDLYALADDGTWRYAGTGRPERAPKASGRLCAGLPGERRAYVLNLPLYNGVESVEIGLPKDASLWPVKPRRRQIIVFYGTSIMQGGCASRPGMCHASILGRRLDRPIINLGFSGNGTMDIEVGELMAELDVCLYYIDCLPNMGAEKVSERTVPLVKLLRKARPETPIALVEDRTYSHAWLAPATRQSNDSRRKALKESFDALRQAGVEGLHYIPGEPQLGDDSDGTVDGSHATDLGFVRMADYVEPLIRPLVQQGREG